ncbi:hypothetical protein [Paenarthrobacter nicotinovorans]|nr:hypothetical protein [Paenarthrobacter nicotinovorans]
MYPPTALDKVKTGKALPCIIVAIAGQPKGMKSGWYTARRPA